MTENVEKTICFLITLDRHLRVGPHLIRRVENGIEPACLSMHILMANEELNEPFELSELQRISAAIMEHLLNQVNLANLDQPWCEDLADLMRNITDILQLL